MIFSAACSAAIKLCNGEDWTLVISWSNFATRGMKRWWLGGLDETVEETNVKWMNEWIIQSIIQINQSIDYINPSTCPSFYLSTRHIQLYNPFVWMNGRVNERVNRLNESLNHQKEEITAAPTHRHPSRSPATRKHEMDSTRVIERLRQLQWHRLWRRILKSNCTSSSVTFLLRWGLGIFALSFHHLWKTIEFSVSITYIAATPVRLLSPVCPPMYLRLWDEILRVRVCVVSRTCVCMCIARVCIYIICNICLLNSSGPTNPLLHCTRDRMLRLYPITGHCSSWSSEWNFRRPEAWWWTSSILSLGIPDPIPSRSITPHDRTCPFRHKWLLTYTTHTCIHERYVVWYGPNEGSGIAG